MVDSSNESLDHADEESHTLLLKCSPLEKNFKMSSVVSYLGTRPLITMHDVPILYGTAPLQPYIQMVLPFDFCKV